MKIADILQSLNMVRKLLSKYIQNDLVISTIDTISWGGYRPGVFNNQYYPLEYQWMLDNQQYSFLLSNGTFLQFYYYFNKNGLFKGKIALYPRPITSICSTEEIWGRIESYNDEDNDLSQYLFNVVEEIEKTGQNPSNTSHIRFDFDENADSHEKSHIQFSGVNEIRIHADFFPTPYAFIELVSDALQSFDINITPNLRAHSLGKTLRGLSTSRLINLSHQ